MTRLGGLALVVGAALACEPGPTIPPEVPGPPSKDAAALVEARPDVEQKSCRFFVNDQGGTHEVRVDAYGGISIESAGELVMPLPNGYVVALWPRQTGRHYVDGSVGVRAYLLPTSENEPEEGKWDLYEAAFSLPEYLDSDRLDIESVSVSCFTRVNFMDDPELLAEFDEDDTFYCSPNASYELNVEVTATLGPWVSWGGAITEDPEPIDLDAERFLVQTLDLSTESPLLPADLLGKDGVEALRNPYAEEAAGLWLDYHEGLAWEDGEIEGDPDADGRDEADMWNPEDISLTPNKTGLNAEAVAWFEIGNRPGYYELFSVPLPNPHPELEAWLPKDHSAEIGDGGEHTGWMQPGCALVDNQRGLVRTSGKSQKLDLHGHITGVYFVADDFPFEASMLRPRSTPAAKVEGPLTLKEARAAVKAKNPKKAIAILETMMDRDANAHHEGELCWAYFLDGQYAKAEGACRDAMVFAKSLQSFGAITYNLGRLHEAQDNTGLAAHFYELSHEVRPRAAVRERIDKLERAEAKK